MQACRVPEVSAISCKQTSLAHSPKDTVRRVGGRPALSSSEQSNAQIRNYTAYIGAQMAGFSQHLPANKSAYGNCPGNRRCSPRCQEKMKSTPTKMQAPLCQKKSRSQRWGERRCFGALAEWAGSEGWLEELPPALRRHQKPYPPSYNKEAWIFPVIAQGVEAPCWVVVWPNSF